MRGVLVLFALMYLVVLVIGPFQNAAGYPLTAGTESYPLAIRVDTLHQLITGKSAGYWMLVTMLTLSSIYSLLRGHDRH